MSKGNLRFTVNPQVDQYLLQGCGRCPLVGTPDCKVHSWAEELQLLRAIVLDCGLDEELKWSQPCYSFEGKNVLIISAFKNYCALNIFKGGLLKDEAGLLVKPGENTQAGRQMRFTDASHIAELQDTIKAYILEAIEVEKSGVKLPETEKNQPELPEELLDKFAEDSTYKQAFEALTPGRQRSWLIHFTQAKQTKTRVSRIEKSAEKVMAGKGWNER